MTSSEVVGAFAGIVLTGGSGRRLGGVDKARLTVGGTTLLDRAVEALRDARPVVVVGPEQPVQGEVRWTREAPPGGGPAAGLLAGLAVLPPGVAWVGVLAVDMPFVDSGTFARLVSAVAEDGALLVDPDGRQQYLCAVYRRAALTAAASEYGDPHGLPVRRLVGDLRLAAVAASGSETTDLDLPADLDLTDDPATPGAGT